MPHPARVAAFAARALLYVVVLALPMLPFDAGYAVAFRGAANTVFGGLFDEATVTFSEKEVDPTLPVRVRDTRIVLVADDGRTAAAAISTRNKAFLPTAVALALVLATPVTWRRRGLALVLAALAVQLFVAVRVWIHLLALTAPGGTLPLASMDGSPIEIIRALHSVLYRASWGSFVPPLLIWAAVTLRPGDGAAFATPTRNGAPPPGTDA